MSITYHERPGVYSDYDASSVTATGRTDRVIALVGQSEAKSGLYTVTSYASGRETFGESSQLGRMLKLAYQNGAGTVLACPVAEDTEAAYQAAFARIFAEKSASFCAIGSAQEKVQLALRDAVEEASGQRGECIGLAGMASPSIAELTARAEKLNSERMVLMAHRRGMPAVIHCIGDAAMEICLNAIEKAQKACPEQHPRHGIIHCQITDEKLLDRFAELGVQAYVQPVFLEYDAHIVDDRVGRELGRTSYAWRSLLERGVNVSAGSDCPVENMDSLPNIYCAVTRMDFDGKPEGGWNPQEDLSPEQALRIFTRNVAAVTGEEDHRSDLIPGNDADLTILDEDFFEVPAEHIKDIQPYMTIVDGKIRFRAK